MKDAEKQIAAMCRSGDTRAFDLLVAEFGPKLYSFIITIAGAHESADEILQETFLKAYREITGFRGGDGLSAWLRKIAYNLCMNYMKRESLRPKKERVYEAVHGEIRAARFEVEKEVIRREEAAGVRKALMALPEKQRTAIFLFEVEEIPIKQIAGMMECSEGTVMSHLHRARESLRKKLLAEKEI